MNVKVVTVPNRNEQGYLIGTKNILVNWTCPECGERMGDPEPTNYCEDGSYYVVDTWNNLCGHTAKYKDLKELIA